MIDTSIVCIKGINWSHSRETERLWAVNVAFESTPGSESPERLTYTPYAYLNPDEAVALARTMGVEKPEDCNGKTFKNVYNEISPEFALYNAIGKQVLWAHKIFLALSKNEPGQLEYVIELSFRSPADVANMSLKDQRAYIADKTDPVTVRLGFAEGSHLKRKFASLHDGADLGNYMIVPTEFGFFTNPVDAFKLYRLKHGI